MKFTEERLEQAFIELLQKENYPHFTSDSIARAADEVLIDEDLLHYLLSRYENEQLTETEAKTIILQLKTLPASDLYESNKTIQRWLSDGFILKREDRNRKDIHVELIDFSTNHNIYKFVNQLEIVGTEKRIPDGILYINGLPVVVFEFKSAIREEATIHDAYVQLTTRYKEIFPNCSNTMLSV
ncbi:hypothetical protein AGMMS4957_18900 [Bacteroidia bacterium]|nr:hypothetical protein AGMMS4957_18900 [Bacteroidia bacterium]